MFNKPNRGHMQIFMDKCQQLESRQQDEPPFCSFEYGDYPQSTGSSLVTDPFPVRRGLFFSPAHTQSPLRFGTMASAATLPCNSASIS